MESAESPATNISCPAANLCSIAAGQLDQYLKYSSGVSQPSPRFHLLLKRIQSLWLLELGHGTWWTCWNMFDLFLQSCASNLSARGSSWIGDHFQETRSSAVGPQSWRPAWWRIRLRFGTPSTKESRIWQSTLSWLPPLQHSSGNLGHQSLSNGSLKHRGLKILISKIYNDADVNCIIMWYMILYGLYEYIMMIHDASLESWLLPCDHPASHCQAAESRRFPLFSHRGTTQQYESYLSKEIVENRWR